MSILEANCRACGETFNPADDDDLEHIETADGEPCGGTGEMLGAYLQPSDEPYHQSPTGSVYRIG